PARSCSPKSRPWRIPVSSAAKPPGLMRMARHRVITILDVRSAFHGETRFACTESGHRLGQSRSGDARQRREARKQLGVEALLELCLRILRFGKADASGEHVLGSEWKLDAA